eukprot:337122-Pelagomonas_calceolata.AAC.1
MPHYTCHYTTLQRVFCGSMDSWSSLGMTGTASSQGPLIFALYLVMLTSCHGKRKDRASTAARSEAAAAGEEGFPISKKLKEKELRWHTLNQIDVAMPPRTQKPPCCKILCAFGKNLQGQTVSLFAVDAYTHARAHVRTHPHALLLRFVQPLKRLAGEERNHWGLYSHLCCSFLHDVYQNS